MISIQSQGFDIIGNDAQVIVELMISERALQVAYSALHQADQSPG